MAESPEDLGREIDRLWAKVATSSLEAPEPASPPSESGPVGQEMAWEAVSLLKKQHRSEARYWSEILESKERALASLRERQALLDAELQSLRGRAQSDEARIVGEALEAKARVEAAFSALEQERSAHEEEQRRLRALLEQTRARWQTEAASWRLEREQFDKREQKSLLDLKDLQALSARYQKEAAEAADATRRLDGNLKEAKNAIEKTLSELLRERQVREESEKEREKALKKVDEIQKHFEELSKIWEEERAQWRELWDRERSTWETQRQEFAAWEENLRGERQAWQAEMQAREKAQLAHADQLTETLRQSAETSTHLAEGARRAELERRQGSAAARAGRASIKRRVLAFAAAALVAVPVARYATRYHFKAVDSTAFSRADATSLAFDGSLLWASEWDGKLAGVDPRDLKVVREASPKPPSPYRPLGLVFGGPYLWTVDAAQARILRHKASDPEQILAIRPSPGAAPTAVAFDGESLWSYDAANKSFYRHGADEANYKAFAVESDAVVTAMSWIGGELWAYDSKARALLVFSYKDDALTLRARYPMAETIIGMLGVRVNAGGKPRRELWALCGPSERRNGFALVKYEY